MGAHGRVLDVGCGTGATSAALAEFGRVFAVDLSAEAIRFAQSRGLETAAMNAGALAISDQAFQLVVALDVIEHLEDDRAAMDELRRVLAPGGRILVTVPAYKWLWSSHDVANGHWRRYRRGELKRLLEVSGFQVEVCSYVMMSMLLPAAAYRLLERLPGRHVDDADSEVHFTPVPPALNWFLSHFASWGGYLAGRVWLPFGLSIAAVARLESARATVEQEVVAEAVHA
jgi:SAM-dependent methyltransferase